MTIAVNVKAGEVKDTACISMPIGTNGKQLKAIAKFSNVNGKSMIGKTLTTSGKKLSML